MRGGFRIGRLFGIAIIVDWSWLFIFALVTWNLTAVFKQWHPGWALGTSVGVALAAAAMFFGSVVLHELAHSLVAKAYGMTVREIRLFIFGGVSHIEEEPPSPGIELWIAIAGPLLSLVLGVGLVVVARFAFPAIDLTDPASLAALGPVQTVVYWLGPINVIVGLFNLLPGFPLDGGRVLRALVWKVTGNLRRATFIASSAGRLTGALFILLGIAMAFGIRVPFFGQGVGSGLWLAFIGWFLSSAATRTFGAFVVHEALQGVRVATVMRRMGPALPPDATVRKAIDDWFMQSSARAFPVVDDETFLGMVSVNDLRKVPPAELDFTRVTMIMTPRAALTVAVPDTDAESALRMLGQSDTDQLAVVEDDLLAGMLSRADITRWLELHEGGQPTARRPRAV